MRRDVRHLHPVDVTIPLYHMIPAGRAVVQGVSEDICPVILQRNRHGELGKYLESISHSLSRQNKKKVYFQTQIRGL